MSARIYFLDDEPFLCEAFKEYFSILGFEVETFRFSEEMISRCETMPPDFAIIDYRLTETTGDKVAERIDDKIHKILVTGEIYTPNSSAFLKVFKKPYRLNKILQFINEIIS